MFPGGLSLSLTLSPKTTGHPGRSLKTCWHLNGQSTSGASQRNFLVQTDRDSTGKSAPTSCKISLPLPHHSAHFLLQFLDLAHVWSGRQDNDIHMFDILSLAAAVYILSRRIPGGLSFHHTLAHLLKLVVIARLFARRHLEALNYTHRVR